MPPKKQAQLQIPLETQDEWTDFVNKDGLAVVDVYSAWCGPCKAVQGLFRRMKNELGDDLLRFALAKSDTVEFLEPYRNKSMPTFLMYAHGILVSVVRGALGPLLERTIKEQLAYEHEVLEGKKERVPIIDEALDMAEQELEEDEEEEEAEPQGRPEPVHKQFTVMVIKPDAVQAGKVEEILEKVKSEGMEVLAYEEHQFTKDEAIEFYKQHEGSDHFEELVEFMCSGPCMTLVLTKGDTGEGVVEEIRDLIGPKDVEQAKELAPESIRATFGTDTKMNAVHASDTQDVAARELAFFMPNFRLPYVPGTEPPIERTLALIRPDALANHKDAILEKIKDAGFEIAYEKELTLSKEEAEEFYKEHEDKDFYDSLTTHMSSGPMMALCLAREDAVAKWREMLTSAPSEEDGEEQKPNLRTQFSVEGTDVNPLHGSDDPESAVSEVDFFFPSEHTLCTIKPHSYDQRDDIVAKIRESGFQVSLSEEATLTKEMAEQLYSKQKDKDYFDDLVSMMTTGPSLFMVLSKPNAIMGWRAMIGPTDPEEAKSENPNSLRALFGKSALENALHGSSDKDHALQEIEQMFGPVNILPGGKVEKVKGDSAGSAESDRSAKDGGSGSAKGDGKSDGESATGDGGLAKDEGSANKEGGGSAKDEGSAKEDAKSDGGSAKDGESAKSDGSAEGGGSVNGSAKGDGSKDGESAKDGGSGKDELGNDGTAKDEESAKDEGPAKDDGSAKDGGSAKDEGPAKDESSANDGGKSPIVGPK